MEATATPPTKPSKKTRSLDEILHSIGPITDVEFDPFKPEPKQAARAVLPSSFPKNAHPFDYFSLFFTPDLFLTITTNTNRYANTQKIRVPQERVREWSDLLMEELYVFLGVIIYMGVHEEP
jgi:hypothetical protein